MKVAVIGAGNVGKALGTSIKRAGHDVTLSASSADSAQAAARELGVEAANDNVEAVQGADLVILAVPYVGAGSDVASEIAEAARGHVVPTLPTRSSPITPDSRRTAPRGPRSSSASCRAPAS